MGLRLVSSLSSEWGTSVISDGGKTVWFDLNVNAGSFREDELR